MPLPTACLHAHTHACVLYYRLKYSRTHIDRELFEVRLRKRERREEKFDTSDVPHRLHYTIACSPASLLAQAIYEFALFTTYVAFEHSHWDLIQDELGKYVTQFSCNCDVTW